MVGHPTVAVRQLPKAAQTTSICSANPGLICQPLNGGIGIVQHRGGRARIILRNEIENAIEVNQRRFSAASAATIVASRER